MANHLIVIAGPTASGKTALALKIATWLKAEIFSADGRQFYRGMNIGTAKPSATELNEVPHHFIDHLEPDEQYSAGQFEQDALCALKSYFVKNKHAILVGGSGLYINAVTEGFDNLPATSDEVRKKFNTIYAKGGIETLNEMLRIKDPVYYFKIDLQNRQRVQRALEAMDMQELPFSQLQQNQKAPREFTVHKVLLLPDRDTLYNRINNRVDAMIKDGLVEEVINLSSYAQTNALNTVGYKEIFDHLKGHLTLEEAIEKIKQHNRNYAKRQTTWFKKQSGYVTFSSNDFVPIKKHLIQVLNV